MLSSPCIHGHPVLQGLSADIWRSLDGRHTTSELVSTFLIRPSGGRHATKCPLEIIRTFVADNLVVLDGGVSALELRRRDAVRNLGVTGPLKSELDALRLIVAAQQPAWVPVASNDDLDSRLGKWGLESAMARDIDAAGLIRDSGLVLDPGAVERPPIRKCIDRIAAHLQYQLPGVESKIRFSGLMIYPGGSFMDWHSNHSRPDGRVYCTWSEAGGNFFRYLHPLTNKITTIVEYAGWSIKSFTIPSGPSRFWHCIGTRTSRFSIGFRYAMPDHQQVPQPDFPGTTTAEPVS